MMNILGRLFGSSQTPKQNDKGTFAIPRISPPLQDIEEDNQQNFEGNAQESIEPPKENKKKGKRKSKAQRELDNLAFDNKSESDEAGDNQQTDNGVTNEHGEEDIQTEAKKPKTKRIRKSKITVNEPDTMHDEPAEKAALAETKKPQKPRKKKTAAKESPQEEPKALDVVAEEVQAPPKISKRKQKKSNVVLSEEIVHEDDAEESPPLNEDPSHAGQQIDDEVSNISRMSEMEDEPNSTPVRPSSKALGKRKAVDTLLEVSSKPKRPRKSKGSPGMSLLDHGFSKEISGSHVNMEDLVQTAQELYIQSTTKGLGQESATPSEKKGKRESKAKTPIMLSGGGSIRPTTAPAKQTTPQSTLINKKSTNAPVQNVEGDPWDLEDPFQKPQVSLPKSNQKRKRRLPVENQEGEPSDPQAQSVLKTPAAKKAAPPKSTDLKQPKEKGPVRKGRITAEEAEAIDTAVETYRELHELTQFRMNELIQNAHGFVESKGFWTSVREAAPEVPHRKIYETCRRKYHNFEAGATWTKEQDDELRDAYKRFPQKWKQIGELINRFPEHARDRWRNYLVCGDKQRKDYWDKEEEDRLREVVAECVATVNQSRRVSGDSNVDQKSGEKLIDWGVVSEKMGFVRSRLQCINKWKQLKEREDSEEDERLEAITKSEWRAEEAARAAQEMTGSDILQLLHFIRDSGAGTESKIPWLVVTEAMKKLGKRMSLKLCFRKLRSKIPNGNEMRFRDALEYLITVFEKSEPNIPARYKDKEVIRDKKRRSSRYSIGQFSTHIDGNASDRGPGKVRRRYNGNEQGVGDMASSSKAPRKRTSKPTDNEAAEETGEAIDNGQEPSEKKKKKTKRIVEAPVKEDPANLEQELETTPAKIKRPRKSKPEPGDTAEEDDKQPRTSKSKRNKKKKLHESMKRRDESQSPSQEPIAGHDSDLAIDDIAQTFQSFKLERKVRKNKARELDDILREEMASRGEPVSPPDDSVFQEGQQASDFSDQEQNSEPSGHLNENDDDDEAAGLSDEQDLEMTGDMYHEEAQLSDEDEEQDTEMNHPIEGQLSDDDEEQEQDAQVMVDYDEMEIDPDEGQVYGIPNGLSPHPSSDDEEETTSEQAESVDLDTLTPVKKAPAHTFDGSTSTSGSSSSDSGFDSDESPQQAQDIDELDQEVGQFDEALEIEDHEREDELERNYYQDSHDEPEQNGHLEEDCDAKEVKRPRSVSPDLDTPIKDDGRKGGRTSVSPDLDTPVPDDGRNGRRSFRARTKPINYDDTAHLAASEGDVDLSLEEPRPQANDTRARKVNGTKPKANGIERRGSVSSSDDSIPAEATPQHIRAERFSQTPPPLSAFREQSEDIDWAAVRRRRLSKGKGNFNSHRIRDSRGV